MKSSDPQEPSSVELTDLLNAWTAGDQAAGETVMESVYSDVRRMASERLAGERRDHTLQATALVHEVYLRLAELRAIRWQGRAHFFGSVAQMLRRILVDHARKHRALKRGSGIAAKSLEEVGEIRVDSPEGLIALHVALERLEREDADLASIVLYRFFGGLTASEIAQLTGRSPVTVKRKWRLARAWLYRQLVGEAYR